MPSSPFIVISAIKTSQRLTTKEKEQICKKSISEQNKLSLCSLEADVFAVINLLQYDKAFSIYPNEESGVDGKNELINRRFKVV